MSERIVLRTQAYCIKRDNNFLLRNGVKDYGNPPKLLSLANKKAMTVTVEDCKRRDGDSDKHTYEVVPITITTTYEFGIYDGEDSIFDKVIE
jgi:hypothetical protein